MSILVTGAKCTLHAKCYRFPAGASCVNPKEVGINRAGNNRLSLLEHGEPRDYGHDPLQHPLPSLTSESSPPPNVLSDRPSVTRPTSEPPLPDVLSAPQTTSPPRTAPEATSSPTRQIRPPIPPCPTRAKCKLGRSTNPGPNT